MTELAMRNHALYRFYDVEGRLLYIGLTADLPTRLNNHRDDKPWWCEVTRVAVEHYPDRAAVIAAERRAIIAEGPRYNVVHNRPRDISPARPADDLIAICQTCRQQITGENGVVHIPNKDVHDVEQAMRDLERKEERRREEPGSRARMDLRAWIDLPDPVAWQVHCNTCNPHKADDGTMCNGCYWFDVGRCATWPDLIDWTCHLSEKEWLQATNWMDWIRGIAHGNYRVGIVACARSQP